MNIEFHYYITKIVALESGFDKEEAEIIAYSSQLVADNSVKFRVKNPAGEIYQNITSSTKDILKPEMDDVRKYILYHFMPGNPTNPKNQRKDGKMHLLMTTPASNYSQEVFYHTTRNDNLYILGIASHMIGDTFTHQNFIGTLDEMNSMKNVWDNVTAHIGHSDADRKPDIPNLVWHDPRLLEQYSNINNKERTLFAAKKIYANFILITSLENNWSQVKKKIANAIGEPVEETDFETAKQMIPERIKKYREVLNELGADSEYIGNTWLNEAVKEEIKQGEAKVSNNLTYTFSDNYQKSNWFLFHEAIKQYENNAIQKLQPLLDHIEVRYWK